MRRMGVHNGSGGTKTMRVRYEVMRGVRGYRGRHMAKEISRGAGDGI
jgi:hypothetical protein